MSVEHVSDKKMQHVRAVAELMYERALELTGDEEYAEEMYVLGFVHDIGYIFGAEGHAKAGGALLSRTGFKYASEVLLHGTGTLTPEERSRELDLIQWCDMSVGPGGVRMTCQERLTDIGERYGFDSHQYLEAKTVIDRLAENGMA